MALTPGLEIPFGIQPVNPVPVDSWSGPYSGSIGNDTVAGAMAAANASIPSSVRFLSMEVRLIIGGVAYKYWYKNGTTDGDLILFSGEGGGAGDSFFTSTTAGSIFTTGSVALKGGESIDSPLNKGSDVFFYVSGSSTAKSLFGGDVVISGTLNVAQGFSGSLTKLSDGTSYLVAGSGILISTGSSGAVTISNDGTVGDITSITAGVGLLGGGTSGDLSLSINDSVVATVSGTIFAGVTKHAQGLSGSLTRLTDGTSYLIAGENITIASSSNGAITISGLAGDITSITAGNGLLGGGTLGDISLSINDSIVATISGSTFTGPIKFDQGLSGSLTTLTDGSPYLIAGDKITIATGSSGAITIAAIVGDDFFDSTTNGSIYTTGSVAFRGTNVSIDSPSDIGSNVFFFVSGSKGSFATPGTDDAVFGGNVVVSGTFKVGTGLEIATIPSIVTYLDAKNFLNIAAGGGGVDINDGGGIRLLSPVTKIGASFFNVNVGSDANFFVSGTLSGRGTSADKVAIFGGRLVSSGAIHALNGLSGSITKLNDGTSYLVAGNAISISSASNGAVTISSTAVTSPGGADTYVQFNDGNTFGGDANLTYNKATTTLNGVNIVLSGDLTVNGTTTTVNTTNLEVKDSVIGLGFASGTVQEPAGDRGWIGGLAGGNNTAFFWDNSEGEFAAAETLNSATGSLPITIANYSNLQAKDIQGRFVSASLGFSGSLTKLIDGTSYLVAGDNITITSASNGAITITGLAGDITSVASGTGLLGGGDTGDVVLSINDSVVATVSGTTFRGTVKPLSSNFYDLGTTGASWFRVYASQFSGSLTKLLDGSSYLRSGAGISIITGSSGFVTISSTQTTFDSEAQYLVLSATSSLSNERVLIAGTGLTLIDAGAGGNAELSINDAVVATISGSTFTGITKFNAGLSGSLTQLNDGSSYLIAGNAISISSASNGAVTISSTAVTSPGGNNSYIQFNDSGSFGGVAGLAFEKATNTLSVAGDITGSNARFANITVLGTASISFLETINQQSLVIGDKYITILSGSADHVTLDGSGILYGSGSTGPTVDSLGANAHILYREIDDSLEIFPGLKVSGSLSVTDNAAITGSLIVTNSVSSPAFSGSLTKLIDGTSAFIAGAGVTISSGSNGSVTISASASEIVGGVDTQVQFNAGGSFSGDSGLTYNSGTNTLTLVNLAMTASADLIWQLKDNSAGALNIGAGGGNYWTFNTGDGQERLGFWDGVRASFGDINDPDLNIQHDGTNSRIENKTGKLILSSSSGIDVSGSAKFANGLSGSLTNLSDGTSYLVAGSNITITSASNGAITIAGLAGDITSVNAGTGLLGGGISGDVTISISDSIVATTSGSTFTGAVKFNEGLSGSLTRLIDGTSFIAAGHGISVSSSSNGNITITSTAVTSPAGSDTQLQFNDGGSFGADNGLTYNKNSNSLFISGAALINKLTPEYGEILSVNQVLTSSSDFVRAGSYIKQILTGSSQFGAGDPSLLYGLVVETYNKSKLESGYGITSFNSYAYHQSTSSLSTMWGYEGGASIIKPEDGNTAGNVSSMVGLYAGVGFQASTNFTGSITDAYGFRYNNFGINAARTVANSYGIKLENVGASTGVTNAIGIDIAQINTASGIKLGIRTQDPIVIGTTNIAGTEKLRVNGTSRFDESANFIQGLSGSLTKLTDGTSYIVAGSNVTITSASNGAITISSLAGDITAVNAGVGLLGGGSSGDITLDINDSIVATTSGSTFTGTVKFNAGLSGSITKLTDGSSYLIAGNNVAITTGSSGAVTIEAIVAGYSKGYLYGSSQDGSGNVNVSSIGTLVNGYDAESDVDVFLNGQLLTAGATNDYTVPTNTTIHFNNTLNPDDVITIRLLTTGSSSGINGVGNAYTTSFTNASLTAGVLTVNHNLNSQYAIAVIYDNSDKQIIPDEIIASSAGTMTVDLTSFGTIVGTWSLVVVDGAGGGSGDVEGVTAGTGLIGGGASGNVTLSINDSIVATISGTTFQGTVKPDSSGLRDLGSTGASWYRGYISQISGSHTQLLDGTSAFIAGTNITIVTGSNGAVTISSTAGGGSGDSAATYLVMSATGSLSAERVLTAGTGLSLNDGGANGNATLSINDSIVATLSGSTFTGVVTMNSSSNVGTIIETMSTSNGGTGTVAFSIANSSIFYVNNPAGNITANFTGVPTTDNKIISTTLILSQSATARIVNGVQVDGVTSTINWANGITPTGNANKQDVFGFTLIRSGSTWKTLGQMNTFG